MEKFSVLMSLYIKEKAEYLTACMESILEQTVLPAEIVIVLDGPITEELRETVDGYVQKYPNWIRLVPLAENRGLGLALAEGIQHCTYELVARMDTDDICRKDRFEKQLAMFANDPELDICGSHIAEFETDPNVTKGMRKVPVTHDAICRYQRKRDSFNHMTVMYKKGAVLRAGNYQHVPMMEDSVLWANMLKNGAKAANVDETLVFARAGDEMIARRGGLSYFKRYRDGKKKVLQTGYITRWDYIQAVAAQFIVAIVPGKVRLFIYKKLLRVQ